MRNAACTFSILVAILAGSFSARSASGASTNAPLKFYVVSEQKMDGGTFIDTPELPKIGYISAKPDLAVTNLKEVYPQKMADYAIVGKEDGTHTLVPNHPLPALAVTLRAEDAKRFTALTERSIGKRLLVMLGDKPLTAPRVLGPIEGGGFLIQFRSQADLKRTEDDLKKLIP